jgi:hypothetical protein
MKVLSILKAIGKAAGKSVSVILPIAEQAAPLITLADPPAGALFTATVCVIALAEQKFSGKVNAGPQKMDDVRTAMGPLITQRLKLEGQPADAAAVDQYIQKIVDLLNSIPEAV